MGRRLKTTRREQTDVIISLHLGRTFDVARGKGAWRTGFQLEVGVRGPLPHLKCTNTLGVRKTQKFQGPSCASHSTRTTFSSAKEQNLGSLSLQEVIVIHWELRIRNPTSINVFYGYGGLDIPVLVVWLSQSSCLQYLAGGCQCSDGWNWCLAMSHSKRWSVLS